jgi:hypothetical protein
LAAKTKPAGLRTKEDVSLDTRKNQKQYLEVDCTLSSYSLSLVKTLAKNMKVKLPSDISIETCTANRGKAENLYKIGVKTQDTICDLTFIAPMALGNDNKPEFKKHSFQSFNECIQAGNMVKQTAISEVNDLSDISEETQDTRETQITNDEDDFNFDEYKDIIEEDQIEKNRELAIEIIVK